MKKKSNIFVKKILLSTIVGVVAIGILSFCIFQNITMAASYSNGALVTSVLRCVNNKQFKSKVELKDFNKNYATTYAKTSIFMSGSHKVWVPLGFSGDGKDATLEMECREVVAKALSNKGVNIPDVSSTNTKRAEFLKSLGYKGQGSGQSKTCFRFKYTMYADKKSNEPLGDVLTQAICAHIENGKFVDTDVIIQPGNSEVLKHYVSFDYSKSVLEVELWGLGNNVDISVAKGDSWGDFKNNVKNAILGEWPHIWACSSEDGVGCENEMQYRYYDIFKNKGNSSSGANIEEFPDGEDSSSTYTLTVDDSSKKLITGTLTGGSISTYPTISNDDAFNMYQSYLKKYYEADIKCGVSEDWLNSDDAKDYNEITSCSADGKTQTCYAKAMANENENVGGIDTNQHFGADCDFKCVTSWLASYSNSSNTCPKAEDPEPTPDTPGSTSDFDCDQLIEQNTNGEGIGAMQWVLCPSLNNTAYTADWLDRLTKDLLEVNPDMYTGLGDVWGNVRNIANVIIIIFLLIVIFSQLTGYGIDNYGIKKMLPRIITMAIVINLSLYICQLAIDLSNIAGVGLRDIFGTLAGETSNESSYVISGLLGIFAAAPTVGGAVITGLAFGGWVAVVIGLVVLVVVIITALITFFVMLGARDVIIIFCVIISPLAFAAFILPNTQSLFKKWWDLFKAAIIIFPLCGAASGISASLRKLYSDGKLGDLGVGGQLIMLVLPYLVFFLLPMLLKQAISGLGKLGGALTSMGQTVRNGGRAIGQGAMRGAQGTERYKNMQEEAARRRQERYANRIRNRYGDGSDIRNRIEDAQRRLAANPNDRRARNDLASAQRDQRRFYAAEQTHYKLEAEQAVAGTSPEVLAARAQSSQESIEFKNITDQFANASDLQIQTALTAAEDDYAADRSSANATRLRAMQSIAIGKNMNSNVLDGLNRLSLNGNNENDQKVLNSINYSNLYSGLTRAQLGNELQSAITAYNTDRNDSNTARLQNIIKAANGRDMDNEMLAHLGGLALNGNVTNDARILDTLSGVNNKVVKQYGIQMGKPATTQRNVTMTMDQFADSTGPVKLSETLLGKGENYLNDTNDDTLGYIAKHSMSSGAYNPVVSSGTLASITANTTDEKVLREARKIYDSMNADDITFSGNQLAKYDLDTVRGLAARIKPNSRLQKIFVAATNDIAKTPELISNLKPEQRAMFKAIRRGAGINDHLFD